MSFSVTYFDSLTSDPKDAKAYDDLETLMFALDNTEKPTKNELPLVKLAEFGKHIPAGRKLLRNDANVKVIHGIEFDYDAGEMPVAEAAKRLRDSGIYALLHTSARHTTANPRWRVLVPLSRKYTKSTDGNLAVIRERHLVRVARALDQMPAEESFTLSQAFFFGFSADNKDDRFSEVTDGGFIDELPELDKLPEPKSHTGTGRGGHGALGKAFPSNKAAMTEFKKGESLHPAAASVAMRMANAGQGEVFIYDWFDKQRPTLEAVRDSTRINVFYGGELKRIIESAVTKSKNQPSDGMPVLIQSVSNRPEITEITEGNYERILPARYVYIVPRNEFYDLATGSLVTSAGLTGAYRHITILTDDDELKSVDAARVVLHSKNKQSVEGAGWQPCDSAIFSLDRQQLVNTYRGPAIDPVPGDPALWLELMDHVYGKYAEMVKGHMAFTIQKPEEKIRWQVMVIGTKTRTGKTSTVAPLAYIYPTEHQTVTADDIDSGWGDAVFGKKVVIIEELYRPGDKAFFNSVKAGLVNSAVEMLNLKGKGIVTQQNLRAYYLFTNHWNSIHFDKGEDKLLVVEGPKEALSQDFFDNYHNGLNKGELAGQVLNYLQRYDLSNFNHQRLPERTAALMRLCEESAPDYQNWIREKFDEGAYPFSQPCISFDDVTGRMKAAGHNKFGSSGVRDALTSLGLESVRAQQKTRGQLYKKSLWVPVGLRGVATDSDLLNIYRRIGFNDKGAGVVSAAAIEWLNDNGYSNWQEDVSMFEKHGLDK